MKYSHLEAFQKHLQSAAPANLAPLYLVISREEYERERAVDDVFKAAFGASFQAPLIFQGANLSLPSLMQELNTIPFFHDKIAILVEEGEKLDKEAQQRLKGYFNSPNPRVLLVIAAHSLSISSAFYKEAEKGGVILDIPELKRWEKEKVIEGWLGQRFKEEGKVLEPAAAQLMARQLGTDKTLLNGEVEKLVCFVGSRSQVTMQDVRSLCATLNLEGVFQLGDFILSREVGSALRVCRALLEEEFTLLGLIAPLRKQLQNGYELCSMAHEGHGPEALGKRFPNLSSKLIQRNLRLAQGYGLDAFRKGLILIHETELKAKNSAADPHVLAEMMITRLATL